MGGTGAGTLPRDLSVLTERERQVYLWAVAEVRAGRYPSLQAMACFLGLKGRGSCGQIRDSIRSKVGWPCPIQRIKTGTHGLTAFQREVLTTACAIWEDLREYPSREKVARLMGRTPESRSVLSAIRNLESLGLFPCRRTRYPAYLPEHKKFIIEQIKQGNKFKDIKESFMKKFKRKTNTEYLQAIKSSIGLQRSYSSPFTGSIEDRKSCVIADRGGLCPARLEEPSAYRRVLRDASRRQRTSPSSPSGPS